ncbi:VOC family protein [Mesorhizobium sp.]|uniref:VOC family protein n=1 Tax=Mesorhizobium sp. TaxID=1871066 RepID=UPI000FE504F8|nr:VOC family protein [Mesorhizobium sp.]RWI16189.1 MAG: ring-cleaving dioxygenase [Mesorhizobium sp.]RWK50240.1 MAG: ring-cleaving dioxygenase [Mesorhizobium sp.]RWK93633.1 MAG: ring-cleaving dioxygenase [Mesorhizobium sp.]TIP60787.1 MAG: ring-cleaving dioxygenase [Mesorhizobium sp.]TIP99105.1 MAG: ring-cleaving dioxygenase [Mesorhizobium sp.]
MDNDDGEWRHAQCNGNPTSGIHHVTLITRRVQANVDFYVGFLGLRLVKRIGGFEDGEQLHLFYGDRLGSPGSLVTFLVWEDGSPGRVGTGQVSEIALAVPQSTIGEWMTRALSQGVTVEGPVREFGEPVLRLKDPDGIIVKLVGADIASDSHRGHDAVACRLRAVTILTDKPEETMSFLERFGYGGRRNEGAITRMFSDTDAVDVRDASGYVPGIPGTGTVDHAAFRAADVDAVKKAETEFSRLNSSPTNFHDRKYFTSLYVREPGGTLFELATEGPGFTVDEQPERLGQTLFIPPGDSDRAEDLKVMLPQFAMPGKPRIPRRELPFVHRLYVPEEPDESTIVLLHGTGGSEADLMPVARRIAPQATLLGLRGRSHEEGVARWFRRLETGFDQDDIKTEAEAFEAFVDGAISGYGLDRTRMAFLGYSNGANFIAAVIGLRPKTVRRAILLRPIPVLDVLPAVDLTGAEVLMLSGAHDPFGRNASVLQDWFRYSRAALDAHTFDAGHELVAMDTAFSREWLQQNGEGSES